MNTYGIRAEIETTITGKYTGYTSVYKFRGQDFPALRDLLGKVAVLRNGNKAFVVQSQNAIALFCGQERINAVYGKRLTAMLLNQKGNISGKQNTDLDIMSVSDADGNLFWERKNPAPKAKPIKITDREAKRLLTDLLGEKFEITQTSAGGHGRNPETIKALVKERSQGKTETVTETKADETAA